MRIVVDLQSCQSGSRFGGIGRYSMNLIQAMARNIGEHELHVVLSGLLSDGISSIYSQLDGLIPKSNIHIIRLPEPIAEEDPNNLPRARAAEIIREAYVLSLNPDVIHITSLFEGLGENVSSSVHLFSNDVITAVTLYDLIPLVEKDKYLSTDVAEAHYLRKVDEIKKADILLSISEFSKLEALDLLKIEPNKVVNISSAADDRFMPHIINEVTANEILNKYGITRKYLMYTGSFDQRKNHKNLIKAFALLESKLREQYQLVIVGNGWDGIYKHLLAIGKKAGLTEDDIVFVGKVPDEDLLPLYNLCHLFIFPSLCEGFGLPVLEAMSCGVPVIGSNTTSIPEVLNNEEALFDPNDPASISKKIYQVITDEKYKARLIEKGLEQSNTFSWDLSAKRALESFERVYGQGYVSNQQMSIDQLSAYTINKLKASDTFSSLTDEDLKTISQCIEWLELDNSAANKYSIEPGKIGWVTTWNSKCGIAMYSKYLINDSDKVTVLAPKGESLQVADNSDVIRCWKLSEDNLEELFQTVLKHDFHTVIIQFNYGFFDFTSLSKLLIKLAMLDKKVYITLHATTDPDDPEKRLKNLVDAFRYCENIFVHTQKDVERLEFFGLKNVQLFYQGVFKPSGRKTNIRIDKKTFVIASYGFFLPNKGLWELILAFNNLVKEGYDVHLLMLNAAYDVPDSMNLINNSRNFIKSSQLDNHVTLITDFLHEDFSLSLLQNADLIVYPYQQTNESSSAAVRMGVATGVPIAVTPLSIFDEFESFAFVLPGTTVLDITEGIKEFLSLFREQKENVDNKVTAMEDWSQERFYPTLSKKIISMLDVEY